MAIEAQGPEKARPYIEKAVASFSTVIDEENLLGQLYGFKAIPNGFLIDEQGLVRYRELGGFDIRQAESANVVEQWITGHVLSKSLETAEEALYGEHTEANALFRSGLGLYRQGKVQDAIAEWRRGMALDPDNYIIRKQMWAVENPDKFYEGSVDYDWQSEQLAHGR